jgi:hypothetical protein
MSVSGFLLRSLRSALSCAPTRRPRPRRCTAAPRRSWARTCAASSRSPPPASRRTPRCSTARCSARPSAPRSTRDPPLPPESLAGPTRSQRPPSRYQNVRHFPHGCGPYRTLTWGGSDPFKSLFNKHTWSPSVQLLVWRELNWGVITRLSCACGAFALQLGVVREERQQRHVLDRRRRCVAQRTQTVRPPHPRLCVCV